MCRWWKIYGIKIKKKIACPVFYWIIIYYNTTFKRKFFFFAVATRRSDLGGERRGRKKRPQRTRDLASPSLFFDGNLGSVSALRAAGGAQIDATFRQQTGSFTNQTLQSALRGERLRERSPPFPRKLTGIVVFKNLKK